MVARLLAILRAETKDRVVIVSNYTQVVAMNLTPLPLSRKRYLKPVTLPVNPVSPKP